jgi:hypothetical protein
MGAMSDFVAGFRMEFPWLSAMPNQRFQRRRLTDQDHLDWQTAQDLGAIRKPKPQTIQEVKQLLTWKDPMRMRRMRKDFAWMEKQLAKMGLNPEDARYLL